MAKTYPGLGYLTGRRTTLDWADKLGPTIAATRLAKVYENNRNS
jgi:hypothetical protein